MPSWPTPVSSHVDFAGRALSVWWPRAAPLASTWLRSRSTCARWFERGKAHARHGCAARMCEGASSPQPRRAKPRAANAREVKGGLKCQCLTSWQHLRGCRPARWRSSMQIGSCRGGCCRSRDPRTPAEPRSSSTLRTLHLCALRGSGSALNGRPDIAIVKSGRQGGSAKAAPSRRPLLSNR